MVCVSSSWHGEVCCISTPIRYKSKYCNSILYSGIHGGDKREKFRAQKKERTARNSRHDYFKVRTFRHLPLCFVSDHRSSSPLREYCFVTFLLTTSSWKAPITGSGVKPKLSRARCGARRPLHVLSCATGSSSRPKFMTDCSTPVFVSLF